MKKFVKILCFVLAVMMLCTMFGCKKKEKPTDKDDTKTVGVDSYIGTWVGNDHDGKKIVHYLIFDENGYWNVYMNSDTLTRAIRQKPDQLVSFKVFKDVQNSGHTGCYYEYVSNEDGKSYVDVYTIDEEGRLTVADNKELTFEKYSTHTGAPDENMEKEARELFDHAWESAHTEE